jgi:hypothetical protein
VALMPNVVWIPGPAYEILTWPRPDDHQAGASPP